MSEPGSYIFFKPGTVRSQKMSDIELKTAALLPVFLKLIED